MVLFIPIVVDRIGSDVVDIVVLVVVVVVVVVSAQGQCGKGLEQWHAGCRKEQLLALFGKSHRLVHGSYSNGALDSGHRVRP